MSKSITQKGWNLMKEMCTLYFGVLIKGSGLVSLRLCWKGAGDERLVWREVKLEIGYWSFSW